MMATFQGDVLLTAFFLNNLTGTGRINYIHSTYGAHQTAKRCFDSSLPLIPTCLIIHLRRNETFTARTPDGMRRTRKLNRLLRVPSFRSSWFGFDVKQ